MKVPSPNTVVMSALCQKQTSADSFATILRASSGLILIKVLINHTCFKLFFVPEALRNDNKRKVEVFSAGCALCHEVIDVVRVEAGSSCQIIVHDMMDARVLARAEKFGIRSVPAVVIDGKLASCCTSRGVDIQVLKSELGKTR